MKGYNKWLSESKLDPSKAFKRKSTVDSYLNMRDFWRSELGEQDEENNYLKKKMFLNRGKIDSINVDSIIPNQDYLDADQVEKYKSGDSSEVPLGVKFLDGSVIVYDGHHRIAAQILKGSKAVNMKILKAKI